MLGLISRRLALSAALSLMSGVAFAVDYHVDGAVAASGNGLSWDTAWKRLADINWRNIKPGDAIYVSGGSSGQVYAAPLNVGADGAAGQPITIAASVEEGRNGPVVLDGRNSQGVGIAVEGDDHITIRGFDLRNFTVAAVKVGYGAGVVVEGNKIFAPARGVRVFQSQDAVVRGNVITTPTFVKLQTDGIYSQENVRPRYERNVIVISNAETSGHDDGIQSFRDTDLHVEANYVEQRNPKTGNAQGIFAENGTGAHKVVNNIVYAPNTKNALAFMLNRAGSGYSGAMLVYNNTLVGSEWGIVQIENSPFSQVKNNILHTTKRNGHGVTITGARPQPQSIDHNIYYTPNGTPGRIVSSGDYSWSRWRGLGYEASGANADPRLSDIAGLNFIPAAGSLAINAGAALVGGDIMGVSRPQSSAHDIGAYEVFAP